VIAIAVDSVVANVIAIVEAPRVPSVVQSLLLLASVLFLTC
jgi:hypothetical protein